MSDSMEFENATQAFFEQMARARAAGKDWWADLQIQQLTEHIAQQKLIAELAEALAMVRDADNDCRADGFPTIPPIARAKIDAALAKAGRT